MAGIGQRIGYGVAGVAVGIAIGTAVVGVATPPSDPPPTRTTAATGTLDAHTRAAQDGISLGVRADSTVATFEITYPVGSNSGWHAHPGIVVAVVRSGAVNRQVGCTVQTFVAGQSFTEVAPHFVSNFYTSAAQDGAVPAVLEITQIYPADATSTRIDEPAPVCPHGTRRSR